MAELKNLVSKYDILEQKYSTLKLENEQYKQLIREMAIQNRDLKDQVECFENSFAAQNRLKPMLQLHITTIDNELEVRSQENVALSARIREQGSVIESLTKENGHLVEQNNVYQSVLETNQKENNILKQRSHDKENCHQSKICLLQDEVNMLRQQITEMKNAEFRRRSHTITPRSHLSPDEEMYLHSTLHSLHDLPRKPLSFSKRYSTLSTNDVANVNIIQHINTVNMMDDLQETERIDCEMDEIRLRIEQLEMENTDLKETLTRFKEEERCVCGGYKFIDESESEDMSEECDSAELMEMEKLYEKCEGSMQDLYTTDTDTINQSINQSIDILSEHDTKAKSEKKDGLVDTYKWAFFELQLWNNKVELIVAKNMK